MNVYIFGGKWGESILLHIPGAYSALIDCFDYSQTSEIRSTFSNLGITKLDLLVLTHPHLDHFKDVYHLANEIEIEKVCSFGYDDLKAMKSYFAILAEKVNQYQKKSWLSKISSILNQSSSTPKEYKSLAKMLTESQKNRGIKHIRVTNITPIDSRPTLDLKITAVTPIGRSAAQSEKDLIHWLLANPSFNPIVNPSSHDNKLINSSSVSIHVKYGTTAMLFCADADDDSLGRLVDYCEDTNNEQFLNDLSIIKVSHHGSETDNPERFWKHVSQGARKPLALCTYFNNVLPKYETFELIEKYTGQKVKQPAAKNGARFTTSGVNWKRDERTHPMNFSTDKNGNTLFL